MSIELQYTSTKVDLETPTGYFAISSVETPLFGLFDLVATVRACCHEE